MPYIPHIPDQELERRAQHCVTHHGGCDCREWAHRQEVAKLKREYEELHTLHHECCKDNKALTERLEAWRGLKDWIQVKAGRFAALRKLRKLSEVE